MACKISTAGCKRENKRNNKRQEKNRRKKKKRKRKSPQAGEMLEMDSFGFSTFRFPIPETRQSSASRRKKGLPTVPNPEPSLEPEKYKTLTQVNSTGFRICHGNSQLGVGRTGVAPSELPQSRTSPRPDRSTQKIYHGKGQNHSSNLVISTPSSKGPSVLNSRVVQSPKVAMDHQRNGSVNPYLLFNLTVDFARDSQLCGGC